MPLSLAACCCKYVATARLTRRRLIVATSMMTRDRVREAVGPNGWAGLGGMGAFILLLHAVGFGLLFFVIVPAHYQVGAAGVYGVGLGITAYTLGMRHAFDADHIAAIDNTTRKLMGGERKPLSVGFWFSLGHSSV